MSEAIAAIATATNIILAEKRTGNFRKLLASLRFKRSDDSPGRYEARRRVEFLTVSILNS